MATYECVEFGGVPPDVSISCDKIDEGKLIEWITLPQSLPQPTLLVLRQSDLDELSRHSEVKGSLDYSGNQQHKGKALKAYLLGKSRPAAIFAKYTKAGMLEEAIMDFLAEVDANRKNLYLIGVQDIKDKKGNSFFEKIKKLAKPRVSRIRPVAVPQVLREKFWGDSPDAERVREDIIKAAQVEAFRDKPVLILGDSGCGKEIVAEEIHNYGRGQNRGGFYVLNCAAIPSDLLETELFGIEDGVVAHVKGRIGLWELASKDNGTLFLDEIGDLWIEHQPKVLRALQENKVRRIGGREEVAVNTRILAATNRDLIKMIAEGSFRPELYGRLAQIVIRVPKLAGNFKEIERSSQRFWREVTTTQEAFLSPDVIRLLARHAWPGGLRELHHFLEGLYFQIYGSVNPGLEEVKEYWRYRDPRLDLSAQDTVTPVRAGTKRKRRTAGVAGTPTKAWVESQVKQYREVLPKYENLAQVLGRILETMAPHHAPLAVVKTRTRSAAAFAEKIQRSGIREDAALVNFTDCCGARVIVQTTEDVRKVASFLDRYFEVDLSSRKQDRPAGQSTWTFQPISYVLRLDRERADRLSGMLNVDIPDDVLGLWGEVQIRTVLEQAWANVSRETTRESPARIPTKWTGELTALAELLKAVDQSFSRIQKGLQIYNKDFSSYATRDDLLREIDILETALACDPGNMRVAARVGRLALALGNWDAAIRSMEPHEKSGFEPLLRDLGVALCQKHRKQSGSQEYARGQKLLEAACAAPGSDLDAFASLAGTWKRSGDLHKARDLYLRAHVIDPADSYALGCYLEIELNLDPQIDIVTTMKPSIELAIERCRELALAGVNLPWAYFDLGKFQLLLGRRAESLSAYTRAVQLSVSSHQIRTSLESLNMIGEAKPETDHLDEARQLLALGLAARFPSEAEIQTSLREWSSKEKPTAPIVIVTGHVGETQEEAYRFLMAKAFSDFSGTLISLVCSRGLREIVKGIGGAYPVALKTIIYEGPVFSEPKGIDPEDEPRPKAEIAGCALQAWTDVVKSGVCPEDSLMLGFGSGEIWAEQCFLALALGARVVGVKDPGSLDVGLPADENWVGAPEIKVVAAGTEELRAILADSKATRRKGQAPATVLRA